MQGSKLNHVSKRGPRSGVGLGRGDLSWVSHKATVQINKNRTMRATTKHSHYNDVMNERDNVSNHQPQDCLLNHLFGRRSKKTSKLRVTGLCAGNSPGIHHGPVTPYGVGAIGQYWLRSWLVAWWHQVITWTNFGVSSMGFSGVRLKAISPELLERSLWNMLENTTLLKFLSRYPWANKLMRYTVQ